MRSLNDEEIKEKLGEIQPEGFDWVNVTETEMVKFRAIAQAQHDFDMKEFVKWGKSDCPHRTMANLDGEGDVSLRTRAECPQCWQALQQQAEGEG